MAEDETYDEPGVRCIKESKKAILVDRMGEATWVPKSVLHDDSEVYMSGDEGKLIVELWWAEKEGWI